MSLNWDSNKCANPTPADENEAGGRECLIWGSIATDMGEITEKNVDEWLFRFKFLESVGKSITNQPMTRSVIERWVGLRMNVVTLTRKKWMKRVMEQIERDVSCEVNRTSHEYLATLKISS